MPIEYDINNLRTAISSNRSQLALKILKSLYIPADTRKSIMLLAVRFNELDVLKRLNVTTDEILENDFKLLKLAVENRYERIIIWLYKKLQSNHSITTAAQDYLITHIAQYALFNLTDILESLFERPFNIHVLTHFLKYCAYNGEYDLLRVNSQKIDEITRSPWEGYNEILYYAVKGNQDRCIRYLVISKQAKAIHPDIIKEVNLQNSSMSTIKLLIEAGVNLSSENSLILRSFLMGFRGTMEDIDLLTLNGAQILDSPYLCEFVFRRMHDKNFYSMMNKYIQNSNNINLASLDGLMSIIQNSLEMGQYELLRFFLKALSKLNDASTVKASRINELTRIPETITVNKTLLKSMINKLSNSDIISESDYLMFQEIYTYWSNPYSRFMAAKDVILNNNTKMIEIFKDLKAPLEEILFCFVRNKDIQGIKQFLKLICKFEESSSEFNFVFNLLTKYQNFSPELRFVNHQKLLQSNLQVIADCVNKMEHELNINSTSDIRLVRI